MGGRGGEGTVHFRPIYEKWGGGGGGTVHFRSDTFVWHTENTLSLIINGYNFDQGGCSMVKVTSHGGGGGGFEPPCVRPCIVAIKKHRQ